MRGKQKLANKLERDPYIVQSQPNLEIPVYIFKREHGTKQTRTVHRNLLLPISSLPTREVMKDKPENISSKTDRRGRAEKTDESKSSNFADDR